jgi:uncharacterized protein YdeI (YjbR/CyaY-like superfamily)
VTVGHRDERVDAYIERAAPFARPILAHLRELAHEGFPAITEEIKWGAPHFTHHGLVCAMAAFKGHCILSFWNSARVLDGAPTREGAAGQFGRIRTLADLPPDEAVRGYVAAAARLNEEGGAAPARSGARVARAPRAALPVPDVLAAALAGDGPARASFERLSPSHQRDYNEWVADAKSDATRARRVATALEWLAEGKTRNWKYERR